MAETADLIVVGGGIVGCAVVQHCAELLPRDARIVLLDRGPIAGATSASCMGHLMVTPDDAQEYAFSATSVKLWAELEEREGGFDYNPTGALYLADDPADIELFAVLQKQFADHGDRAEILDQRQLRDLEPGLAPDLPGALFYRGDGVVLPMLACGAMLRQAQKQNPNVDVRPHTPVTGMLRQGDRIVGVQTANGAIHAEHVVNCCGVWAPELAEMAGQPRLPIVPRAGNLAITGHHVTPIRTQLLEISYIRFAHGAAKVDPTRTDDPGGHAMNMQPQSNGGCLIGSTRQFRGMDRTLNKALLHRSLLRAQRYAPGLAHAPIVRTWVGLRPYSLDKHPLIGPWPPLRGLWIAAGHEGLGITLSPITGRLLAEQIAGRPTTIDATPYLPARFLR
ncbi:MAG: NAD(P)/FAD-dependent oxidoreductase [Planctomycetota bacterium]|jgi:glycine/D-amino acid oxidase-like deaminating enzyme